MSTQEHTIQAHAGVTLVERILLPAEVAATIIVAAAEYATVRVLIESVASCNGSVEIHTHAEPGAQILVGMCVRVTGTDSLLIKSFQHHKKPHGTSRVWVRKILSDQAFATYEGFVHVAKEATGTIVSQDDKTLLDGLQVRAESTPILEVLTNDVACSHGSALGRVDLNMVWYMQTRGFAIDEARALLYTAFFDELCHMLLPKG